MALYFLLPVMKGETHSGAAPMNNREEEITKSLMGEETDAMLMKAHGDALWILEIFLSVDRLK